MDATEQFMDATEQFNRTDSRNHITLRFGIFAAFIFLMSVIHCSTKIESLNYEERKEILDAFTQCLDNHDKKFCEQAYYPDHTQPSDRIEIEAQRGEQAKELYKQCIVGSYVKDQYCDDEVFNLMRTIKK